MRKKIVTVALIATLALESLSGCALLDNEVPGYTGVMP